MIATSEKIATLNDIFRQYGYSFTLTQGVQAIDDLAGLLLKVRLFNTFTEDNDPYGEHDFGKVEWQGETVFWKIDYYDSKLQGWCDPLDAKCTRVLTVMLSEEY